jgi:hypothetical protein
LKGWEIEDWKIEGGELLLLSRAAAKNFLAHTQYEIRTIKSWE